MLENKPIDNSSVPALSIVIPVFDEQGNVSSLVERLTRHLSDFHASYEIIFVDDGSHDATWEQITKAARNHQTIKGISLTRNFGHQHALLCGLSFSSAPAVICMDGDLQHPPELIGDMFRAWQQGYKIVSTTRVARKQTSIVKRITSKYFYKLFSFLSGVPINEGSSDFCLVDRGVLELLLKFKDLELFLRGAIRWTGFPSTSIPYDPGERLSGKTKYGFFKMLRFALSAIVAFSSTPLKLGIWIGIATSALAFLELFYILIKYLQGITVPGWASTVGILSFLFGILFILLGCIGLYLANIHEVLKDRPRFIIGKKINWE